MTEGRDDEYRTACRSRILDVIASSSICNQAPCQLPFHESRRLYRHVRVTVTDSGTGIDQDSKDRIFDTFFTTKSHGMGMGLSICRSIVEAHGGKLSASRSHPYGSIFEIDLPTAKMDDR